MKKIKHFKLFVIVYLVCFIGGGCPQKKATEKKQIASVTKSANTNIPQPLTNHFNVAFVYVGPIGDGGWTYAHDLGRKFLQEKLPQVHTAYIESVSEGAEAEQAIRGLARKGFDLIIGTSFGYMDSMETIAKEFPKTKFVHISGYKSNGKNFGNLFGAMESMKYLAGMIAGARAQADGKNKLGYIAPYPIPEVIRLLNAVMLGARQTCPKCEMEIRWIHTWFDPAREREAAESLLKNQVQVVITGADTPGPIIAAQDAKKWAIGYDSINACQVAPSHCLTIPYWSWGSVYVNLVQRIQAGHWQGGSEYLDVDSGIVGLYGFMPGQEIPSGIPGSPANSSASTPVKENVVTRVKELLSKMQAGAFTRFDVFAGPIKDNQGKQILAAGQKLSQQDLEGLAGCKICMNWLVQGIVGQLPARK